MRRFWAQANFWKWCAIFLLLAAWTYINYRLEIYFPIILLAVFCLVLLLNSRLNPLVVTIPIFFIIVVFTQSLLAWNNVKITNQRMVNNFRSSITRLMTPNTGTEILPEPVLQIHALLDAYDIKNYRLTEKILADPLVYQRTIDSTWPITENPESKYILGFIGDIAHYGGCSVIEQRQDIEVGTCR